MRILGIDLGSWAVKAVEMDSAFGRFEVHEYHEIKLGAGESPLAAAQTLIRTLPKTPDKIIIALRTNRSTFRNLTLPTKDRKAIQTSVGFELEDELPFPMEQAIHDFSILSQVGSSTTVHVAASMKKHVGGLLAESESFGLDPDVLTTEPWAYRAFFSRTLAEADQARPLLMVQIGHDHTTIYGHWKGQPLVAREIPIGGRDLTLAICQKYNLPLDQAERAKIDNGFVLPPSQRDQASEDQKDFSDSLTAILGEIAREVRQSALAVKKTSKDAVSILHLAGGTAQLPGLAAYLEEETGIPVKLFQALSGIGAGGVTYSEQTDATFGLACSLCMSVVSGSKSPPINLRRHEFAKQGQTSELNWKALQKPLLAAAVVMLCLFVSLTIQSMVYKSRIKTIDAQLERSVKTFFGVGVSSSAVRTYLSNTSTLRKNINTELDKQRETAKLMGPNPHSPTNFLKELSAAVPKDIVVDMIQFQAGAKADGTYSTGDDTAATLTFLMENQAAADRLQQILDRKLSGAKHSTPEETTAPDGTSKRWKVVFTGKILEDAYGK